MQIVHHYNSLIQPKMLIQPRNDTTPQIPIALLFYTKTLSWNSYLLIQFVQQNNSSLQFK